MPKLVLEIHFIKKAHKLLKKYPELDPKLSKVLDLLQKNPFLRSLKTHSLTGKLKGKYACSLSSKLRIVFNLSDNNIHLLNIGSHDEVY